MRLFGRHIRLTFEDTVTGHKFYPDGERLNIGFTVERTLDKEPSTMDCTIHNLAPSTRQNLKDSQSLRVHLEAGYVHNNPEVIFVGDVRSVRQRREPPLHATDIEAGDGEKGAKNWARKWFPKDTSVDAVFRYLAGKAGYGTGNVEQALRISEQNGLPARLDRGIHVRGYAVDEMNELARSRGIEFSVQGNEVQLVPYGGGKNGVPVTTISAATGMIGFPSVDNKGVLTVNHRLLPNVFPGSIVKIKTADGTASGDYRVLRALYSGSLYGDDFNIEIEGQALR